MQIRVLYEDKNILALDKPVGLLVHSDGRSEDETLVHWLNENYPELAEVGEEQILQNGAKIKRPGIVHRLDKDTSGVILIARNKEAFEFLKKQFQDRKVKKIYHAVVWGNFSAEKMEGTIEKPIGRSASDFRKWSAEYGAKGEKREAVTEYKVLTQSSKNNPLNPPYIKGEIGEEGFAYLEVRPKTGRTHQIRVHLKSISHPVMGDKLYGANPKQKEVNQTTQSRLMLHAVSVELELPDHVHIKIESPLPAEFENIKKFLS